jgi:hypothetical protein
MRKRLCTSPSVTHKKWTPTEMAGDFREVLDAEKLAVLLAYTVRRCALQEVDLEG